MDQNQYSFGGMNIRPDQYQQLEMLGLLQSIGALDNNSINSGISDILLTPQQVNPMEALMQAFYGGSPTQSGSNYGMSMEGMDMTQGRPMTQKMMDFGFKAQDPSQIMMDSTQSMPELSQDPGIMSKAFSAYFGDSPLALFNPLAQASKGAEYITAGSMGGDTLKNSLEGDYGSIPGAIYNIYNRFRN